jgi:hypothetical protein
MKWYSIKEFQPSYDGKYIVRYVLEDNFVGIKYTVWNGHEWLDFNEPNHLLKGKVTHFSIPAPIEIK